VTTFSVGQRGQRLRRLDVLAVLLVRLRRTRFMAHQTEAADRHGTHCNHSHNIVPCGRSAPESRCNSGEKRWVCLDHNTYGEIESSP